MKQQGFWRRAAMLYIDGFRQMTLGRTLWMIIAVKLIVIFAVLKVFFFPNFLKQHAAGNEAAYVATEMAQRSAAGHQPAE